MTFVLAARQARHRQLLTDSENPHAAATRSQPVADTKCDQSRGDSDSAPELANMAGRDDQ